MEDQSIDLTIESIVGGKELISSNLMSFSNFLDLPEEKARQYYDNFVAIPSYTDKRIISYGKEAFDVFREATLKGIKGPVIFYFQNPNNTLGSR
jgi:hypothetical protein